MSEVDESERCNSACDEVHSSVAADHRIDERKSQGQEQIRVGHFDCEHCDDCKRERRKKDKFLFVAVLEVERDDVRFKHENEDKVENIDALLRRLAVHCDHAVKVESILDEERGVGHFLNHHFESEERVTSLNLMDCARNCEQVRKDDRTDETEDDFRTVCREFLHIVVVLDVHIHEVCDDDRRNCKSANIEHCSKRHDKVSCKILLLYHENHRCNDERDKQTLKRAVDAAHKKCKRKKRIQGCVNGCNLVSDAFLTIEINHADNRNVCYDVDKAEHD